MKSAPKHVINEVMKRPTAENLIFKKHHMKASHDHMTILGVSSDTEIRDRMDITDTQLCCT